MPAKEFEGHRIKPLLKRSNTQGVITGGPALIDAINRAKLHLAKFILQAVDKNSQIIEYKDFKGKTALIRATYIKVSSFLSIEYNHTLSFVGANNSLTFAEEN